MEPGRDGAGGPRTKGKGRKRGTGQYEVVESDDELRRTNRETFGLGDQATLPDRSGRR